MEVLQQRMKERTKPGSPTTGRRDSASVNRGSRQLNPPSRSGSGTGSVIIANGELPTDRRALVVEEMLVTEESYIDDLRLCIDSYLFPLRNSSHLMKSSDVSHIFSNMEFLYFIHCEIYHRISDSVNKEEKTATLEEMVTAISQAFIQYADRLVAVYGQYCVDHVQALDLLQKCINSNNLLKTWLDTQMEKATQGLYLRDFLIKPIQRICKYPLLFRELTKLTTDSLQEDLQRTQDLFEEIAGRVNTNKAAQENKKKIEEIENLLEDYSKPVVAFGRVFHKEGDLMKYNKKLKGQVRYCFLFSDMLIYTLKKGSRYQFKGEIPLNGSLVGDINDKSEAGTKLAAMGKDVSIGFQVTHLEAKRIYYFFPATAAEKKDWVQKIEVLTQQAFEAEKKRREESGSGSGSINPIGRFWKGREPSVTLNSITAKYGAMSPASAERKTVPIKPKADENGSGISLASRSSASRQRPMSMQVSEVNSSGSEIQQMMKAVDTMLTLEKQERVKLSERLRETEKRLTELQQTHEEKLESLQKVIAEQREQYAKLEETVQKLLAENAARQEAEIKREEIESLNAQLAALKTAQESKEEDHRNPAPTPTTTEPATQEATPRQTEDIPPAASTSETQGEATTPSNKGKEKEDSEEKKDSEQKEAIVDSSKKEKSSKKAEKRKEDNKKPQEPAANGKGTPEKDTSSRKAKQSDSPSTPKKAPVTDEADLGVFSPRKNLHIDKAKDKDNRGSRLSGLFSKKTSGNDKESRKTKSKKESAKKAEDEEKRKDKKEKGTKDKHEEEKLNKKKSTASEARD